MEDFEKIRIGLGEVGWSARKMARWLAVTHMQFARFLKGETTSIQQVTVEECLRKIDDLKRDSDKNSIDEEAQSLGKMAAWASDETLEKALSDLKATANKSTDITALCRTLAPLALEQIARALAGRKASQAQTKCAEMILQWAFGRPGKYVDTGTTGEQEQQHITNVTNTLREKLKSITRELTEVETEIADTEPTLSQDAGDGSSSA